MKKLAFCMAVLFLVGGNLLAQRNTTPTMRKRPSHDMYLERATEQPTSTQQDNNVTLVGRWPNGPCYSTFVVGDYAYIGNGGAMEILDISNPNAPVRVGQIVTPSVVQGIYVSGDYAYVADDDAGLRVIDISTPSSPAEVGFSDLGGRARDVYVVDDYAYMAYGGYGLSIFDISDPSSPYEVGYFYSLGDIANDVYVLNNYAYVANDWQSFLIIDVSTPSSPAEVGSFATEGDALGVYVQDTYAYVTDGGWGGHGLHIIDISTPSSPTEVGFFDTGSDARGVHVLGNSAYVAGWNGLYIIDVSTPSLPAEVGFFDTESWAWDVHVFNAYAYVADGDAGLRVIDVSTPSSPTEDSFFDTGDQAWSVCVRDSYAYVADGNDGLRIIDISTPSSPNEIGFFDTLYNDLEDICVQDTYAYVADGTVLRIIDVSNPTSPYEAGFFGLDGWIEDIYVLDSYVYVANGDYDLHIIDISTPSSPTETGFCYIQGYSEGIYVLDNYAYLAAGDYGLRIIDVSTPSSPTEVGFCYTEDYAYGVYVQGSYAYVADDNGGLRIIDVSTPSSPTEVGSYWVLDAHRVCVLDNYAYVAEGWDGSLRIVDVSTPSLPTEVGSFYTGGYAEDVHVVDTYAYVAARSAGLYILRNELLLEADIDVFPESLHEDLFTGETSTQSFTISNQGEGKLTFRILTEREEVDGDTYKGRAESMTRGNPIRAFVLDSWGAIYAQNTWRALNANYSDITIDYTELTWWTITYSDLQASGADVLIISDAWNPDQMYGEFSDDEIAAITQYVNEGCGLIATGGTLNDYLVPNHSQLAPLFGLLPNLFYEWSDGEYYRGGTYSQIDIEDPLHRLFKNITSPYVPSSKSSSVPDTRNWYDALNDGKILAVAPNTEAAITVYQNRVFISHVPEDDPNADDYTLLYNSIVFAGTGIGYTWFQPDPISGTVSAGSSIDIQVTFDGAGLYGGEYDANIVIYSNDPDEHEVVVPVLLHVASAPDILLSENALDYGVVYIGSSDTITLIVSNEGTEVLTVSDISSDNSDYTVNITSFVLNPGESHEVLVTFTPNTIGEFSGILTITSDDPDEPIVTVSLQGEGLEPPIISVGPDSLGEALYAGETSTQVLTISNYGGSDLTFDISIEGEEASSVNFFAGESVREAKVVAVGKLVSLKELNNQEVSFPKRTAVYSNGLIDKGISFKKNHSTIESLERIVGEEVFGSDENEYFDGPRTRGNLFTCTTSTTLKELSSLRSQLFVNGLRSCESRSICLSLNIC